MGAFWSLLFKGAETAVSTAGLFQQASFAEAAGKANEAILQQNAATQRQEAAWMKRRAELDVQALERSLSTLIGRQRAAFAESGVTVDVGSPADVIVDSAKQAAMDIELIEMQADFDAWSAEQSAVNSENQARIERWTGERTAAGKRVSAAGAILSGASDMWDTWKRSK